MIGFDGARARVPRCQRWRVMAAMKNRPFEVATQATIGKVRKTVKVQKKVIRPAMALVASERTTTLARSGYWGSPLDEVIIGPGRHPPELFADGDGGEGAEDDERGDDAVHTYGEAVFAVFLLLLRLGPLGGVKAAPAFDGERDGVVAEGDLVGNAAILGDIAERAEDEGLRLGELGEELGRSGRQDALSCSCAQAALRVRATTVPSSCMR